MHHDNPSVADQLVIPRFRGAVCHCALRRYVVVAMLFMLLPSVASSAPLNRKHHAWARFKPGAWKQVRAVTETLDVKGEVERTSITETTTTLMAVEGNQFTLQIKATVEVSGKRFESKPVEVKQTFCGALPDQKVEISDPVDSTVSVDGRQYACQVITVSISDAAKKTTATTKIYISDVLTPHVLRRESVIKATEAVGHGSQTTITMYALDMPKKVLSEVKPAAFFKVVHSNGKGKSITWAESCAQVPGEIISKSTKEIDNDGRLVRRTTLELVNYGLEPRKDAPAPFRPRRRAGRRQSKGKIPM